MAHLSPRRRAQRRVGKPRTTLETTSRYTSTLPRLETNRIFQGKPRFLSRYLDLAATLIVTILTTLSTVRSSFPLRHRRSAMKMSLSCLDFDEITQHPSRSRSLRILAANDGFRFQPYVEGRRAAATLE
ncbi:hypothetical protein FRC02_004319 [Tulasnella sp. 418]|nr:hypothetical protein FRC02_004319 [Tulasnella sp. 418]